MTFCFKCWYLFFLLSLNLSHWDICSGYNVTSVKAGNIKFVLSIMLKKISKDKRSTYVHFVV